MATDDPQTVERVARRVLAELAGAPAQGTPPLVSAAAHALTRALLDSDDPYREIKRRSHQEAMALYPRLKQMVRDHPDALRAAALIAAAGNVLDFGFSHSVDLEAAIADTFEHGFVIDDWREFRDRLDRARDVVYLADNAGEVVFDRVLIEALTEELPDLRLTYVVKGSPCLNDATLEDAQAAGIAERAALMTTGQAAVGFIAETASPEFLTALRQADLIVAKGQANYESLDEFELPVIFILKAKCRAVADALGVEPGQPVLKAHGPSPGEAAIDIVPDLAEITTVVFDLDGVIYRGRSVLPHAVETVAWLHDQGYRVYFMTNNSGLTRSQYADRLRGMGIPSHETEIMTSAYASGLHLRENGLLPATAYVISDGGLEQELMEAGVDVLAEDDDRRADYVIVGMDRRLTYAKLERAQQEILRGSKFIASNADPTYPVEGGVMPGAGTVVSAIQTATGQEPVVIGKPKTYMIDKVIEQAGVGRGEVLVVGDRLSTDIELAKRAGVTAALVLTGVSTRSEAESAPEHQRPDWILRDLGELPARLVGRGLVEASRDQCRGASTHD